LHTHNYFKTFDAFHLGTPTRVTFADKAVPNDDERLRPSVEKNCFSVPWFKKFDKEWIERYAKAFRKVVENYKQLLDGDENKEQEGRWHGTFNEKVQQKDEA
jgi:hypothetical protein